MASEDQTPFQADGKRKVSYDMQCIICGTSDPKNALIVKAQKDSIDNIVSSIKKRAELLEAEYITID